MRKVIKIFKWTFIILILLITGVGAIVASRQHLTYNAEYPNIVASKDTAIIARGKHLVYGAAHCIDCHHKGNSDSLIQLGQEVPLTGAVSFVLPVGTIYSKNITPDKETGIGTWTKENFLAQFSKYSDPNYQPATVEAGQFQTIMPWQFYAKMKKSDLEAVYAYLRTVKPVHNEVIKFDKN